MAIFDLNYVGAQIYRIIALGEIEPDLAFEQWIASNTRKEMVDCGYCQSVGVVEKLFASKGDLSAVEAYGGGNCHSRNLLSALGFSMKSIYAGKKGE